VLRKEVREKKEEVRQVTSDQQRNLSESDGTWEEGNKKIFFRLLTLPVATPCEEGV